MFGLFQGLHRKQGRQNARVRETAIDIQVIVDPRIAQVTKQALQFINGR